MVFKLHFLKTVPKQKKGYIIGNQYLVPNPKYIIIIIGIIGSSAVQLDEK